ncbi:MAG TPA: LysE family translocator [Pseudomonas sp.]|nr:LysE family translocator [Pseudomonas sp.]
MANLELFIGALVVVYVVPGPDMVLVLQTSSMQGRWHAVATAFGLALARVAHVVLAAVGLAVLLKTVSWAFDAVRLIGALYLIWLGVKIARAPSLIPDGLAPLPVSSRKAYGASACRGLLTNISNPKALLFCSVLLPQFVDATTDVASQFVFLGGVLVLVGLFFDLLYALLGAALGHWMRRYPLLQTVQRWTFATLLVGFGLRLAVTARP